MGGVGGAVVDASQSFGMLSKAKDLGGRCVRRTEAPLRAPDDNRLLDVEVLHELRVLLDEHAPRLDFVAHQRLEDLIGHHRFFDVDA
jgi:hypothetical protein